MTRPTLAQIPYVRQRIRFTQVFDEAILAIDNSLLAL